MKRTNSDGIGNDSYDNEVDLGDLHPEPNRFDAEYHEGEVILLATQQGKHPQNQIVIPKNKTETE